MMSLEAVISRIDQIQQLHQQLFPIGSTSATGGVGLSGSGALAASTDSATAGSTADQASFAAALADAQAASTDPVTVDGATTAPTAVQAMVQTANSLVGKPYVWGGGHSGWGPSTGYDCSGFVSAVLHSAGYLSSPQDTQSLPSSPGIASGPGQYVTIYDRTDAGSNDDHVIIDLAGQFYEAGGQSGAWGGGGGVQRIATPSASYLASFNQMLHPVGL